ncbi:peptidylprolyl isomerase [Neolewinella persica]|uniref:peptidylprolyl isomerase n=1 Tax=Neolewinella persica TaxID=70998 RepID=UPI00037CBBE0|nr:peptidylprolyl isomerase [Neolewinella persica]
MFSIIGPSTLRTLCRSLPLFGLLAALSACIPPQDKKIEGVRIDLNDPVSHLIYNHQNARNSDSLIYYLSSENSSYRYLAARAFGSFPEISDTALDELSGLLDEDNELIRTAAAYALGQSGSLRAADSLAQAFDGSGTYRAYNGTLLAAVGKSGGQKSQDFISKISTYTNQDTLLTAGQAWSLFYFARRELQSPAGDAKMLAFMLDESAPYEIRRPAAWYLQRFAVEVDSSSEEQLRQILRTEQDPDVLMGTVRTLGRSGQPAGRVALLRALRAQTDWRVRTEILRALSGFDYSSVREPIVETLSDEHPLVRRSAAEFLRDNGQDADATFYRQLARDSLKPDVRYVLYAAAHRHLPLYFADYRGFLNYDLQEAFTKTTDPFEQAEILGALAEYPWNYRNIYELYQKSDQPMVRSAAAGALQRISNREDFNVFFKKSSRRVRYDLSIYFREMIYGLEAGPASEAGNALAAKGDIYRPFYPEIDWMSTALMGFKLPRDYDAYLAVDAARVALGGEETPGPEEAGAPVKPIDWKLIGTDAGKEVVIRTEAGRIVLKLWPDIAPATVSNFLELVKSGYYDGKVFHRVVPNFVAQGGGLLGNGYGAEDFKIRTETPGVRWDRSGLIGMASSGKDTEDVQFFLTHRATPHLDGNYTIFGAVVEGQEFVDQLTVGSKMESITLR